MLRDVKELLTPGVVAKMYPSLAGLTPQISG
jgi:hypothetical protein